MVSIRPLAAVAAWLCLSACSGSGPGSPEAGADGRALADRARADALVITTEIGSARDIRGSDARGSADGGSCKPYCYPPGSPSQGWYDGCTKQPLELPGTRFPYYDTCDKCTAECRQQPAEGWYSSCSNQLIKLGCD